MSLEAKTFLQGLGELLKSHENKMFEYHKRFFDDYNKLHVEFKANRSANKLVEIKEGVEYQNDDFFTMQCIETNTEQCIIMTEYGELSFPPGSFYKGANYPINILMLKQSGNAKFVGYIS